MAKTEKTKKVAVAALRANLARVLRIVGGGGEVDVIRYGKTVARIVPPAK